jgi:hypothetical protein
MKSSLACLLVGLLSRFFIAQAQVTAFSDHLKGRKKSHDDKDQHDLYTLLRSSVITRLAPQFQMGSHRPRCGSPCRAGSACRRCFP